MLLLTCLSSFPLPGYPPPPPPDALAQRPDGCGRRTAAALMDRFIQRDEVVFCVSSRHICPVLLGSGSARFCWDTDMQVGPPPPLHKQTCRAKPSQAADRRQCQMHKKRENVLYRPELCSWEGCVFSIAFKQNDSPPTPPTPLLGKTVCRLCLVFGNGFPKALYS